MSAPPCWTKDKVNLKDVIEHNKRVPAPGYVSGKFGSGGMAEHNATSASNATGREENRQASVVRPSRPILNKTERRWRDILVGRGYRPVWEQAIRLKLAERLHYTPDLAVIRDGVLTFYEVKGGFERDDAIVKLKAAAKLYPQFDFIKAKWNSDGWTETEIPK